MKIIGHRGAAGVSLENTASSLKAAVKSQPDAIEIDVRRTKDNHLVLCHDHDLTRMASNPIVVAEEALAELQSIELHEKEQLLNIETALKIIRPIEAFVELKDQSSVGLLSKTITKHSNQKISVVSFDFSELQKLQQINPDINLYLLERTKPIESLQRARAANFFGVGLNFWLLNPLTYFLAKRYGLKLYVYTVNSRWLFKFIRVLYPKVAICTDFPGRFTKRRLKRMKKKV